MPLKLMKRWRKCKRDLMKTYICAEAKRREGNKVGRSVSTSKNLKHLPEGSKWTQRYWLKIWMHICKLPRTLARKALVAHQLCMLR